MVIGGSSSGGLLHIFYQIANEYVQWLPGLRSDHLLQATLEQTQHLRALLPQAMQLQLWIHSLTADLLAVQGVPAILQGLLFNLSLSAQTLLLRMLLLIPAIPASALIVSVVIAEALLSRERRRLRGGRERGYVYHRLQKLRALAFYLPCFIWMCIPIALPPALALATILPPVLYLFGAMVLFKRNV